MNLKKINFYKSIAAIRYIFINIKIERESKSIKEIMIIYITYIETKVPLKKIAH